MQIRILVLLLVLAVTLPLGPGLSVDRAGAQDGVIVVDDGCTLIDAIEAANTDTAAGGCTAGSGEDVIQLTADITLTDIHFNNEELGSTALPPITSMIVIEGRGFTIARAPDAPPFRFFLIEESGGLRLENVTLTGGLLDESIPTNAKGGAVFNNGGVLQVADSRLANNAVRDSGGAIYVEGGSTLLVNTVLVSNTAYSGGGIDIREGEMRIEDCTFSNNVAQSGGGGLSAGSPLADDAVLVIMRTTFSGNQANDGGGLDCPKCEMEVYDSLFANNTVEQAGGGVYVGKDGAIAIVSSTFSGNAAGENGGGLINWGYAILRHATVANNTAPSNGGVFAGRPYTENNLKYGMIAHNNIFWNNDRDDCMVLLSGWRNFSTNTRCSGMTEITGLDPELKNNGGPTLTHALLEGSSAIDAGDDDYCAVTDQRGAELVGNCDAGAFEFGGQVDTDGDGVLDAEDNCPFIATDDRTDSDGDGFGDVCDACVDAPGTANGCPDADGDNILDADDACPSEAGLAAFDGCPDTDGDGVIDSDDECPTEPGMVEMGGCLYTGTTNANANLREGPGTNFGIAAVTAAGDELALLGRNAAGDWLRVRTAPVEGEESVEAWCAVFLITTDAPLDTLPVVEE